MTSLNLMCSTSSSSVSLTLLQEGHSQLTRDQGETAGISTAALISSCSEIYPDFALMLLMATITDPFPPWKSPLCLKEPEGPLVGAGPIIAKPGYFCLVSHSVLRQHVLPHQVVGHQLHADPRVLQSKSVFMANQDPRYLSLCHKEPAKGKKCPQ